MICVNDVVFRLLRELDMRKMVCFEKQENHFVGVHEKFRKKLLICGLCFRNILCVQLNDFMS